jgi:hypothetical protein
VQSPFITLKYTWADGNQPQGGFLVIGHARQPDTVKACWIDSWHMSDKFTLCQGTVRPAGILLFIRYICLA